MRQTPTLKLLRSNSHARETLTAPGHQLNSHPSTRVNLTHSHPRNLRASTSPGGLSPRLRPRLTAVRPSTTASTLILNGLHSPRYPASESERHTRRQHASQTQHNTALPDVRVRPTHTGAETTFGGLVAFVRWMEETVQVFKPRGA